MTQSRLTKQQIIDKARSLGAGYVGFTPVERWAELDNVPAAYYPDSIWPPAQTVIVLGVPRQLPVTVKAPQPQEQGRYHTITDKLLDQAAYRLAVYLNRAGYSSVNIPSDANGENMSDCPAVPLFSHVWAGYQAGLGQVTGDDTLVSNDVALHVVSVLTTLAWGGDERGADGN